MIPPASPAGVRLAQGRAPAFASVLCGIDDSPGDAEIVRQAAVLAGPTARLELLTVTWEGGVSTSAKVPVSRIRARQSLRRAHDIAAGVGAHPTERTVEAAAESPVLLEAAAAEDLLVLGARGGSRAGGIALGSTASAALHRSRCPVMVVREAQESLGFPRLIMLADDGSEDSEEAARLTAAIAGQHDAEVVIAAPTVLDRAGRHTLALHATAILERSGREAMLLDTQGSPARAIPALAQEMEASLLVLGNRHRSGVRALTSVSERVAHTAHCSVLVVRH